MTIQKSVTVRCTPDKAFRVFTREIGLWWPLDKGFSYGGELAKGNPSRRSRRRPPV